MKIAKKIGLQAISLLFELVPSWTEIFRGASDLLDASCQHIHSPLRNNNCYLMAICGLWRFYILRRLMLSIYKRASSTAYFPLSYFSVGKNRWFLSPSIFSSMMKVTIQVTSTLQAMKQWNIYFSFLMVFTGLESINSFLTLFRMRRGESAKMPLTSFPQLCILVLILLSYCCKISGSYLVPISNYRTWTKTTHKILAY